MFFLDDIAISPFKGFMFIAREVANAARQQLDNDRKEVMARLAALHKALEDGEMSEEDFDRQESELLDWLDAADTNTGADESGV